MGQAVAHLSIFLQKNKRFVGGLTNRQANNFESREIRFECFG